MMLTDQQWIVKLRSELKALECEKARGSSRKRLNNLRSRISRSIRGIEWKMNREAAFKEVFRF